MEIYGDFQTSVKRALGEIDEKYETLKGMVICGSHHIWKDEAEYLIDRIYKARINKFPFLGICYGHQLAAIEYARNILNIKDANSEEWDKKGTPVVKKRNNGLNIGMKEDGSYWNNYEVVIDWEKPEWFITTQSHPEYESCKGQEHPLLKQFLKLCGSVK
jgi:CTP synthase (UTP-ammonia lyase)